MTPSLSERYRLSSRMTDGQTTRVEVTNRREWKYHNATKKKGRKQQQFLTSYGMSLSIFMPGPGRSLTVPTFGSLLIYQTSHMCGTKRTHFGILFISVCFLVLYARRSWELVARKDVGVMSNTTRLGSPPIFPPRQSRCKQHFLVHTLRTRLI